VVPTSRHCCLLSSTSISIQPLSLYCYCATPVETCLYCAYRQGFLSYTAPSDYRPISFMPVLSRALEKHIVCTYIYPSILQPPSTLDFSDQYGFRLTGSTTAALVTLFHMITVMLDSNPFVRVIALDFSKAFDIVCMPLDST